jgi:hypothetical protein
MKVLLKEAKSDVINEGFIAKAQKQDLPVKKNGWQFTWRKLFQMEGAEFYKLSTIASPNVIEGMLMLTLIGDEMLFMNNIEVAPHNYGSDGEYENVAGCLLAYACYKSFEFGKNHYLGYLSFDSKTQLIDLYQNKYGATYARGQKMFFDPNAGKVLIQKYLSIDFK